LPITKGDLHALPKRVFHVVEVAGELSLELVPLINQVLVERVDPGEWGLVQAEGKVEALCVVVATSVFNG
jgi:hypothetical protein